MSNETTKITWQCYPQNVESFEAVNFPVVNDAIKKRQKYYEDVNQIDNLPNYEVPDDTGPVVDFQGPKNNEPVRRNRNLSMAPIIVMTDVEPGMIMPGNISVSLPQYMDEHPNYVYPNADQEFQRNVQNSLHGKDILNQPQLTTAEINNDLPTPTPLHRIEVPARNLALSKSKSTKKIVPTQAPTLNQTFNVAKPNIPTQAPVITTVPANTQAPVLNSVQAAVPLAAVPLVGIETAPRTVFKPIITAKNKKYQNNKLLHKVLMYVAIALIIYLIYVILFEKN